MCEPESGVGEGGWCRFGFPGWCVSLRVGSVSEAGLDLGSQGGVRDCSIVTFTSSPKLIHVYICSCSAMWTIHRYNLFDSVRTVCRLM